MQVMYQLWFHAERVMQVRWCSARARHVRMGLRDTLLLAMLKLAIDMKRLVELDLSGADAVAASLPRCAHAYPHREGLPRPRAPWAVLCISLKSACGPAWRTWINGRASNGAQLPTHALS